MSNELIHDLMYRSYEYQRLNSPHIDVSRWRQVYLYAKAYEIVFKIKHEEKKEKNDE